MLYKLVMKRRSVFLTRQCPPPPPPKRETETERERWRDREGQKERQTKRDRERGTERDRETLKSPDDKEFTSIFLAAHPKIPRNCLNFLYVLWTNTLS